jgi:subtilisin family serine protease
MALGMQANLTANAPTAVAPGSMHVVGGGTSASSPVVAGLAALFLEYNPNATAGTVRMAINQCAYTDGFTGAVPNPYWGYGKLDGKAALLCVITDKPEIINAGNQFSSYPNPFNDRVTVQFNSPVKGSIHVYSPEGKLLFNDEVTADKYELDASRFNENYKGILFVRVISDKSNLAFKLIRTN